MILVVVDPLSKAAYFTALKHPFTAKSVVDVFIREVVRLHGYIHSIVSNLDKIFISHFWIELCRLQGTKLCRSVYPIILNQMAKLKL